VQEQLKKTKAALARNTGLTLISGVSYGGRTEIVEAMRGIGQKIKEGQVDPAEINEQLISELLHANLPDPDLLIRTTGRCASAISSLANFLRGISRDTDPVAGFSQRTFRGAGGIHQAAPPVWVGVRCD